MKKDQSMLELYEQGHPRGREAVRKMLGRYMFLLSTATTIPISEKQFRTSCQLMNGLATDEALNAQHSLKYSIQYALDEQEEFRDDIASKQFADDTPATRAQFMTKLDKERDHLLELGKIIGTLDKVQCTVLLERIEQVLQSDSSLGLEARCALVYRKVQSRNRH
jgi:hypothetical protein